MKIKCYHLDWEIVGILTVVIMFKGEKNVDVDLEGLLIKSVVAKKQYCSQLQSKEWRWEMKM